MDKAHRAWLPGEGGILVIVEGRRDLPGAKGNEEMRWEEGWKVEEARVEAPR